MNFFILCLLAFMSQVFAAPAPDRSEDFQTSWYSSSQGLYALPHEEYGPPPVPEIPALEYGVVPESIPIAPTTEQ